jgi:putative oxidoreductase
MAIGLLVLRLAVGLTLAAHGTQKLFGWFGGYGLSGTGQFLEQLGFVPGKRNAFMAGLTETLGGLSLALGLATPVGAALIFSVMIVAGVSAHITKGFFAQGGGYEYTLVLGLAAISIGFTGAGPLALDGILGVDWAGYSGWAAFAAGVAGATVQLATRRLPVAQKAQ